jgi:hypothetical protein
MYSGIAGVKKPACTGLLEAASAYLDKANMYLTSSLMSASLEIKRVGFGLNSCILDS